MTTFDLTCIAKDRVSNVGNPSVEGQASDMHNYRSHGDVSIEGEGRSSEGLKDARDIGSTGADESGVRAKPADSK
jgi:hypothetical protein